MTGREVDIEGPADDSGSGALTSWRGLFGDAATYVAGNVLNRAFPFLLLPVLTRYLTPAEYGTFVMFQVIVNFVLPLIGVNAEAALSRAFVDLEGASLRRYVSTACALMGLTTGALLLAITIIGGPVAHFLEFPIRWLPMTILVSAGESLKAVLLALWQMQKRVRRYTAFTVLQTAIRFGACLAPVLYAPDRMEGLMWGYSLSLLVFALYSGLELVREGYISVAWSAADARGLLRYGVPLVPHRMSSWLTGMAERVIIARLANLSQVGIYSVGYSVGAAVALVQDAFNRAWVPFFFERLKRGDRSARLSIVEFVYWYALAMIGAALLVTILAPLAFPLLGARFVSARVFVVWIAFAYALNGIYKMFANFLFYSGHTHFLSSITVSTGLLTIATTTALVATRGVIGAGYGAVIGQLLACIGVFFAVRRAFAMPWREGVVRFTGRLRWRRAT